jgi:excisionase family DNA binding protein
MELKDVNSMDDTAEYLGISTLVLKRMARERKIGFLRIGRTYVFPREVIETYVKGNTIQQSPPNPHGLTNRSLQRLRRGEL